MRNREGAYPLASSYRSRSNTSRHHQLCDVSLLPLALYFSPTRGWWHPKDALSGVLISVLKKTFAFLTVNALGLQLGHECRATSFESVGMYFRKISPNTTCLYSLASMEPRSLSAVCHRASGSTPRSLTLMPNASGDSWLLDVMCPAPESAIRCLSNTGESRRMPKSFTVVTPIYGLPIVRVQNLQVGRRASMRHRSGARRLGRDHGVLRASFRFDVPMPPLSRKVYLTYQNHMWNTVQLLARAWKTRSPRHGGSVSLPRFRPRLAYVLYARRHHLVGRHSRLSRFEDDVASGRINGVQYWTSRFMARILLHCCDSGAWPLPAQLMASKDC